MPRLKTENSAKTSGRKWKESRFTLVGFNFVSLLVCFFILRLVLFFAFKPPLPSGAGDLVKALLIGFHLDIFVALLLCLPLITWLAILPDRWFRALWNRFL